MNEQSNRLKCNALHPWLWALYVTDPYLSNVFERSSVKLIITLHTAIVLID